MPRILLVFIILLGAHVARAEDEPGNLAGEAEAAPPLSQFEFDSEISQLQAELRAQRDLADLRLKALETEIHTVSGYTERLLLGFLIAGGLVVFVVLYTMSKQTSVNNERMRNLIREADNALDTLHRFTERPEAENFQVSRKLNHIMNKFRERESLSLPQKEMADIYAAAEDPTLPVTLHIQANALRAEVSGDWAAAIELWERLLALDSSLPEILLHLAQNYKRLSEVTTDASVERLRMASLEYFQKYSVRTSVHTHSERELRKTGRIGNEKISEHSHNQPALAPSPYPSAPPVAAPAPRAPAVPAPSKPSMTQTLLSRQDEGAPSAAAATQKIVKQVKETVVEGVTRAQEFIDEAKEKAAEDAKAAAEAAARKAKEKAEAVRAEKARQEAEAKAVAEAEAQEKAAAAERLAKAKAKAAEDAKREQEEAAQRAEEEKRARQEAVAESKRKAKAKEKAAAEEKAAAAKREKEERKAAAKQERAAKRAAAKAAKEKAKQEQAEAEAAAAKAAQDQAAQEQAEAEAAAAKAAQEQAAQEQAEAAAAAKAAQEQAEAEAAAAKAAQEQAEAEAAAARQAEEEQRQAEAEAAAAQEAAAAAEAAAQEAAAAQEQPAAEPEPVAPARVYEEVIVSNNGMPIDTIHKSFKSRLDKASEYFGRFHQTKSRTEKKEWLMAAVEEFKLASKYKYSHDMVQLWGATLMEMGSFDSGSLTEHAREAAVVYTEGNRHFDDAFCNELALCYAALGNEAECRKAMETGLGKQMLNPAIILEMSEFDKFKPRPWFQEIASTLGS